MTILKLDRLWKRAGLAAAGNNVSEPLVEKDPRRPVHPDLDRELPPGCYLEPDPFGGPLVVRPVGMAVGGGLACDAPQRGGGLGL